jgi:3'-phosphoadenosine 5'-phosphosulfate sulfotransferase (PAPS reductase)/FAD synthetase
MDQRSALLYARLNSFKALVNKTSGFIRWALEKVEHPYVACSFGKDSAVMLHLVLQHRPDIPVRFIRWKNETEHIDNYDEIIAAWGDINLTQVEFSRETLSDKRADRYDTTGYDSYFIGLRMQESTPRRLTLKSHGMFYSNKSGLVRISPLSDWCEMDIAAYMFHYQLPVLNTYLKDGASARTASRIPRTDRGIRESFLSSLKHRDFQAYQKLLIKFPEIKDYA